MLSFLKERIRYAIYGDVIDPLDKKEQANTVSGYRTDDDIASLIFKDVIENFDEWKGHPPCESDKVTLKKNDYEVRWHRHIIDGQIGRDHYDFSRFRIMKGPNTLVGEPTAFQVSDEEELTLPRRSLLPLYYKRNHGEYVNGRGSKTFKDFVKDYNEEIRRRQEEEKKRKEFIALQKSTKKYFDVLSDFQPLCRHEIPPEFSVTRFKPLQE